MKKWVTNVLFAMSLLMTNQILAQDENSYHQGCSELPAEETTCGFSCTVCKYEPEYSDVYRCEYEMVPHKIKKTRYCSKTFQKRCCRYVPEYYYVTCTVQVPEYYDDVEYVKKPKWMCEKVCKMVPKYYSKPLECEPSQVCEVPNQCLQQQQGCATEASYNGNYRNVPHYAGQRFHQSYGDGSQGNYGNDQQYQGYYDQQQGYSDQQQGYYDQHQGSQENQGNAYQSNEGYNYNPSYDYNSYTHGYQHYPQTNWAAYSQQQIQSVESGKWNQNQPTDDSWKKTLSAPESRSTSSTYLPAQSQ